MNLSVRAAEPGDAAELVALASAVGAEPEGWLISANGEWRSVGDERRYLKALRRYPNAAVFVGERSDGAIIGRLSLARDSHPASAHVADLGLDRFDDQGRSRIPTDPIALPFPIAVTQEAKLSGGGRKRT